MPATLSSAHAAFAQGITAIHQETVLFDDLSVAENIFLGHAPRNRWGGIDWRATCARKARSAPDKIGVGHLDVDARLRDLGIASKHLVAVARALSIDARVVIMDEPTAALSLKEVDELFDIIELLKSGRQGDPLHQPQVRGDLAHRRPLRGLPRRRNGRRGPSQGREPERNYRG